MRGPAFTYGGVPVPFVASWSAEARLYVGRCPYAGAVAVLQESRPGEGKPQFGKPHSDRQRQAIARGLCDTCGKPLKARTKVSLSHARPFVRGVQIGDILQVEPLLHRECAALSMRHCPSLKRDLSSGALNVRQVTRFAVQFAVMSEEYVEALTGERRKAVGHAKVQLLDWLDRDASWLEAA